MAQIRVKQIRTGNNYEFREEGIIIIDENGQDEWILKIMNGSFKIAPFNQSAFRRKNLVKILDE